MASLATVDAVVNRVQNFHFRRGFHEGRAFILSLDESIARLPEVSSICASFYMLSGHSKWAEDSLEFANYESLISEDCALLQEQIAYMALLAAQVKIRRYCQYEKSYALVREIENLYVNLQPSSCPNPSHAVHFDRIKRQSHLWTANKPEDFDETNAPITDARVFIEVGLFEAMSIAVEQGFMLQSDLDKKLRARIPPLISFLRPQGRRYAEAACFFLADFRQSVPSPTEAAKVMMDYIDSVDDESLVLYKAAAKFSLARHQAYSNPESALLYLDESQKLFASEGCLHYLASVDCLRIRDFQHKTHTLSNRTDQLCSLVGRYRSLGDCWMQAIVLQLCLFLVSADEEQSFGKIKSVSQDVEKSLQAAGEVSLLHVTRVFTLLKLPARLQESEEARGHLAEYLDRHSAKLTPDLYGEICKGLYECYSTLGDLELAAKFAKMETESEVARLVDFRMSDAVYHLACARKPHLLHALESMDVGTSKTSERQALTESLLEIIWRLEGWADWDLQNGRPAQRQLKCSRLVGLYCDLDRKYCPNQGYSHRIDFWAQEQQAKVCPELSLVSVVTQYVQLLSQKKYREGYELAERTLEELSSDPACSAWVLSQARRLVVTAMQDCFDVIKLESLDLAREWRTKQVRYLLEDIYIFYLDRSSEELFDRADLLCKVVRGYLELVPDERAMLLDLMTKYFSLTDKIYYDLRHSLKGELGINQLLRRRKIASKGSVRSLYESASEFFLQVGDAKNAWYWVQRKRGQALLDMLAERSSAYNQIASTFTSDTKIRELLSKEEILISDIANADAMHYLAAVENLTAYREEMKKIPALRRLLDDSAHNDPNYWNDLEDIWSIGEWLPAGTDIILIDWFITPRRKIYWSVRQKDYTPGWHRVTIELDYIDKWIAKYLQFPNDREKHLEREPKAIRKLEGLLEGLATACKPGDLVILTPPARFASIPIHAIPVENTPWIERNQIIYSSSFSLYRECLKRGHSKGLALSNSVFTAAYEEPGYEAERKEILQEVEAIAEMVGGQTVLSTDLTRTAFRRALTSAPWIHYHGHAYYDKSEVLRQSFILSREQENEEQQVGVESARDIDSTLDKITTSMEITSLSRGDIPREERSLLAAHLLTDSSQISVSDIFTLNLTKNHPFICMIACESGLQTISAGDEPLGLVTALFVAGASSVLGTLWPIYSSTGRIFARHFYQSIENQRRAAEARTDVKVKVLNLALAVQEATVKLRSDGLDSYSWAPFVLHGAGFYIYEL